MGDSGGWQEDTFTIDPENNVIRVKLTHLSSVAVTYPADSDRPSTPGTPSVTAGDGQVVLSWTASTDNVTVVGYEVYRSTSEGGTYTNISGDSESTGSFNSAVLVTTNSYTDTNITNGSTYYYKVSAYDNSGNASANTSDASAAASPVASSSGGGGPVTISAPVTTSGQVTTDVAVGGETTVTSADSTKASAKLSANAVDATTVIRIDPIAKVDVSAPAGDKTIVGNYVYDYTALSGGNSVTTFNNAVTLTLTYTNEQISGLKESSLKIYWWNEAKSVWVPLETTINKNTNTLTAQTTHFTLFAIIAGEEEVVTVSEPKTISEMTNEELQAEIARIMALIAQLQAQLNQAEGTTGSTGATYAGCAISSFDRNLSQGMTGSDVKCLQVVLNSAADTQIAATGVGSSGNETEYFGSLTKAAVVKFQEKYFTEILEPWGFDAGTGYVAKTTKVKLNQLLGD
ncbi:MAG: fibronectin type III domain-containing protein, partial [bacterium]